MAANFSLYIKKWRGVRYLEERFWIVGRSERDKPEALYPGNFSPGTI